MRRITGILIILVLLIPMCSNTKVASIKQIILSKSLTETKVKNNVFVHNFNEVIMKLDRDGDKIHDSLEANSTYDDESVDIIVLLNKYTTGSINYFKSLGGEIKRTYSNAIYGYSGKIPRKMLRELAKDPNIVFIQPNMKYRARMFNAVRLMGLKPYVWETYGFNGSSDMSIAIIDSGLDPSHITLKPYYGDANFSAKIVGWYDAVNGKTSPYDDNGHGTSIGSVVAGNVVKYNETTIQFGQFAIVIDGLPYGDYDFYVTEAFPVFRTGDVSIIVKWKDVSIQPYSSKIHSAEVTGLIIYSPDGKTIRITEQSNPYSVNLKANVTGIYKLEIDLTFSSGGTVEGKDDGPGIAYWAFMKANLTGSENYGVYSGVAPEVKLVGVKVLDEEGVGETEDILDGIEWVINNREKYHIVAATITFGSVYVDVATEEAVQSLIDHGIAVVAAAGNEGPGKNTINSPARLEQVIAVGASNDAWLQLNVTNWSSRGPYGTYPDGSIAVTNATKPDIVAPGGDFDEPSIICSDSDRDDNLDLYIWNYATDTMKIVKLSGIKDAYKDDLIIVRGSSISTAQVGGAIALVIDALTNSDWSKWNYTVADILKVKQLLLMTAWEIYRGIEVGRKATRDHKDYVEGYGLVQVDAAIQAYKNIMEIGDEYRDNLTSKAFGKHVWAGRIYLNAGQNYIFRVTVPDDADFDLYIWSATPDQYGQPILLSKSMHGVGEDEYVVFSPSEDGFYYITIKQISGSGEFVFKASAVTDETLKRVKINPPKGSLVDKQYQRLRVEVEVANTYVNNVILNMAGRNVTMEMKWISKDGRESLWETNTTFQLFSANAKIIIDTPIKAFIVEYSLIVIPNYPLIIAVVAIVVVGFASFKGYKYYLKKKEERLKLVEEEARKISEEVIEEVLEEEEEE